MENKITLKEFYKEFKSEVEKSDIEAEIVNRYHNRYNENQKQKGYSQYIFENLIYKVLKEKGYRPYVRGEKKDKCYQPEYYKIDCPGWSKIKTEDSDKVEKFSCYCWSLDFAIEHENNYEEWMDEVIKLLFINCPLRIVIGYNNRKIHTERSDELQLNSVMKSIKKIIDKYEGTRTFISENDEFGIILGEGYTNENDNNIIPGFRYYQVNITPENEVEYERVLW